MVKATVEVRSRSRNYVLTPWRVNGTVSKRPCFGHSTEDYWLSVSQPQGIPGSYVGLSLELVVLQPEGIEKFHYYNDDLFAYPYATSHTDLRLKHDKSAFELDEEGRIEGIPLSLPSFGYSGAAPAYLYVETYVHGKENNEMGSCDFWFLNTSRDKNPSTCAPTDRFRETLLAVLQQHPDVAALLG